MDDAAKCIAGLPLTNENYQHSITLLMEHFGQTDKTVKAHMQAFLALPNPVNNMISLCSFYDSIEIHIGDSMPLDSLNISMAFY